MIKYKPSDFRDYEMYLFIRDILWRPSLFFGKGAIFDDWCDGKIRV